MILRLIASAFIFGLFCQIMIFPYETIKKYAAKVLQIFDICKKNKYFSQKKAERVLCFLTSDG